MRNTPRRRILGTALALAVGLAPGSGAEEREPRGLAAVEALAGSGLWSSATLTLGADGTRIRQSFAARAIDLAGAAAGLADGIYSYDIEFVSHQYTEDMALLASLRQAGDREGYTKLSRLMQKTDYGVRRTGMVRVEGGEMRDYSDEIAHQEISASASRPVGLERGEE